MRRLLSTVLLAVVAASVTPAAVAAAATQPKPGPTERFGVRLVDVPVSEKGNPRALQYIIDYLPTGTTIHRRILVINSETRTAHFTVYADAAQISNGQFTGETGATPSELTGWISVQHSAMTLAPGASEMDTITIQVRQGATRGEHYGVIWVQQTADLHAASGVSVNEVTRAGIRIYLAVGTGGAPPTAFAITSITGSRSALGQPSLVVRADDTGGRAVDLSGTVLLTGGPGGSTAGPFPDKRGVTLAPGQSGDMSFAPPKSLPDGPWQAKVTVVSGITAVTSTQTVQFGGKLVVVHGGLSLLVWGGIVLGVAVLSLALSAILLRRRTLLRRQAHGRHRTLV